MLLNGGRFVESAKVSNGRVRKGHTVRTREGNTITVEAIWLEVDRRMGNTSFICGRNGSDPVAAMTCEKV